MRGVRSFFRHIRDGVRNLNRNTWMSLITVMVMTLTLFMVGLLMIVVANVDKLTQTVENEIQVRVMIDPVASIQDQQALGKEIAKLEHVEKVTYRSKEEELKLYQDVITEDFDVIKDRNPLNDMYLVSVDQAKNIESLSQEIRQLKHVLSANVGSLNLDGLIKSIEMVRYGIAFLASIFVLLAILLITNTIRLTIFSRQDEIRIMSLVGAKNSYIRGPFVIEGVIFGFISACLASLILYFTYRGILFSAKEAFAFNSQYAVALWPSILYLSAMLLIFGIFLGIIGARRSLRKYLTI